MSAEIIDLAATPKPVTQLASAPTPQKAPQPLFLAANRAVRLLRQAEYGLGSRTRAERAAAVFVREAADELERSIAAHCMEESRSLGQLFFVAMGGDDYIAHSLGGIRRALQTLANSLPES